jgi:hypothetical protein
MMHCKMRKGENYGRPNVLREMMMMMMMTMMIHVSSFIIQGIS